MLSLSCREGYSGGVRVRRAFLVGSDRGGVGGEGAFCGRFAGPGPSSFASRSSANA